MRPTRRDLLATLGFAPAALAAPAALGQGAFPDRPIRLLVGFTAGGPTDAVARRAAQALQEVLGQSVVVENRTGAAGNIAAEAVVRAPADGYTLLAANGGQVAVNPHTYARMPFDPMRDLIPVSGIAQNPFLLCLSAATGPANHAEFVAWARRQRDPIKYGTAGAGSIWHVVNEVWGERAGVRVEGVHYRGIAAGIPDVLAGRTPLMLDGVPVLAQHVRAGAMRALLVMAGARRPSLPVAPTSGEVGLPDLDFQNWVAIYAARGTPRPVVERLAEATRRAMANPVLRERLAADDLEGIAGTPEELAARTEAEWRRYGEAVRRLKISADE
jgi:tripartite-type tricarboxylate transporter receptor subunit TctC